MPVVAAAALSARMLAEAARDDGLEVVALDLFGDADTRAAASQWLPIGAATSLRIDADRLLAGLAALAARGDVAGWIAGSGFEGQPELLDRGAAFLPLFGNPSDAVRRVRDPKAFFGALDAAGIGHPEVQSTVPDAPEGWLVKNARGCGGWHIRRAACADVLLPEHHYFQREIGGVPMSATFLANARDCRVLGFNELIVRPFGAQPFVYRGAVGPVPLPEAVASQVTEAARTVCVAFGLRGLGSLDFMREGERISVLEINPRPPASIALYAGQGVLAAHMSACRYGDLPRSDDPAVRAEVRGIETVFAPAPRWLTERALEQLARLPACHDRPFAATRFEAGDPVCSMSASGADAAAVRLLLDRARESVLNVLEIEPP